MRFRKRIKICKGLSINLSKSGTSLTLGGRGASVNVGKKGVYLNTSIPGTGIYDRRKLGGQAPKKIEQNSRGPSGAIKKQVIMNFSVSLDEMGKPIIKDENGNIIIDPSIIKQLKRQESYKDIVRKLVISRKEQIDKINRDFIDIFKQTPNINDMRSYQSELDELRFQEYAMEKFSKEEPSLEKIKLEYQAKSKNPINKILFWQKENKTDNDLRVIYQNELNKWYDEKRVFEEDELGKKEKEDAKNREKDQQRRNELFDALANSETCIAAEIDKFLANLVFPVDFSADYKYNINSKMLYIDLDLPEIEDMPKKKAIILSNGKLSIKPKTAKEQKEDYVRCVTGIAFYLAGNFFNISPEIVSVVISGYTQRLSKKTGNIEDNYIFSIKLDKIIFKDLNIILIDPIEAIQNFKNVINMTSTYELRTIEPIAITET